MTSAPVCVYSKGRHERLFEGIANMEFRLEIKLGNAAMSLPCDVANALRIAAKSVEEREDHAESAGSIRDINGNVVGNWYMDAVSE